MRIEQLQYLEASIRTGSFRRAADELNVAQPTISAQIVRLEEDLGLALLIRGPFGVRPTYAAEKILPHLHLVLRALEAMRQEASVIGGLQRGQIRLATVPVACEMVLPTIVPHLQSEYPGIQLEIVEMGSHDVRAGVIAGRFDAGFTTRFPQDEVADLRVIDIAKGQHILMIPERNPLAKQTTISKADLEGQSMIVYSPRGPNHTAYDELTQGINVQPVFYTDSAETARRMVCAGVGIALINSLSITERVDGGAVLVPLKNEFAPILLSVVLRKDEQPAPATRLFLKLVRAAQFGN